MRRPLPHRLLAAFCALWLAISIARPGIVHDCPMHGGATAGHAAHQAGHSAASHASHGSTDGQAASVCSCLGDCAAAGAVSLAPMRLALGEGRIVETQDPGLPAHAYVPVARALLLPFANGPPALPPSALTA